MKSPPVPIISRVRHYSREIVRELGMLGDAHASLGLGNSEVHALIALEDGGPLAPHELSKILRLEKSTVTRLCQGLIKKGHLQLSADSVDRRKKCLSLTQAGRAILRLVHKESNGRVGGALITVTKKGQTAIELGLKLYAKALEQARIMKQK